MTTWWLSFSGKQGFLGVILVNCKTMEEAHAAINKASINPGGEILGYSFDSSRDPYMATQEWRGLQKLPRLKLLSLKEIEAAGIKCMSNTEAEKSGKYDMEAAEKSFVYICEKCQQQSCNC